MGGFFSDSFFYSIIIYTGNGHTSRYIYAHRAPGQVGYIVRAIGIKKSRKKTNSNSQCLRNSSELLAWYLQHVLYVPTYILYLRQELPQNETLFFFFFLFFFFLQVHFLIYICNHPLGITAPADRQLRTDRGKQTTAKSSIFDAGSIVCGELI